MAKYFGLDIGSSTVKLIVSNGNSIKRVAIIQNRFGKLISTMTNSERIQFTDDLKKMLQESGTKESVVVASLPESLTFSRLMRFPRMSMPELATAIKWELDQSVPFPPSEIESSWSVFEKTSESDDLMSAFVVAVPSKVSELYVQLFELLGVEPQRLENEIVPLTRAYTPLLQDDNPSFLVDFGASGAKIILASKQVIFNNYYFSVGGSAMTKLIADNFGLAMDQAEQYKRTYGMQENQLDGKMFKILKPIIDNFVLEIRKMTLSFRNDFGDRPVNKMILVGGGCYLAGLIPYLSSALEGMEVSIGNVFDGMDVEANYQQLGPIFGLSFGLSL